MKMSFEVHVYQICEHPVNTLMEGNVCLFSATWHVWKSSKKLRLNKNCTCSLAHGGRALMKSRGAVSMSAAAPPPPPPISPDITFAHNSRN
jgi:hypothetical protein